MTDEEINLVQASWAIVRRDSDAAMRLFYEHLFALDERVAQLFGGKNMAAQRSRLAAALDLVVQNIRDPETLSQPLRELGARHVSYGVSEGDFALVGQALLDTLAAGMGDRWNDAQKAAWSAAWAAISVEVLTGFQNKLAA